MDGRQKTPALWFAVPAAILLLLVFVPRPKPGGQAPLPAAPAAAAPAGARILEGPVETDNAGGSSAAPEQAAAMKKVSAAAPAPAGPAAPEQPAEAPGAPSGAAVNAPLTDAQIVQGIEQQKQRQEALKKTLADRDAKAAQVRRSAAASRGQTPNSTTAAEGGPSGAVIPAGVLAKLKNHELVAH